MNHYRVTAVRYQHQQLTGLQLGQGEGPGRWVQEPQTVSVDEVIARIEAGDTVRALLRADGRIEDGPRLKVVTDEHGRHGVALDNAPADCLELADLERF
ncbi:MAG TPA: hypothetical protein VMS38_25005 [Pseudorhodoferax sp.]|jgi:hypothetical protein|nr:hypothetical protein [Pseudorhodoferax sp.]